MRSGEKGEAGERKAAEYFEEKGYRILARRFRSPWGEVDIIARKGEDLVFIEVKTWDWLGADSLEGSLNHRKQERIRRTGFHFLNRHPELSGCRVRFDLVFLSRRMGKLDHWESAF